MYLADVHERRSDQETCGCRTGCRERESSYGSGDLIPEFYQFAHVTSPRFRLHRNRFRAVRHTQLHEVIG